MTTSALDPMHPPVAARRSRYAAVDNAARAAVTILLAGAQPQWPRDWLPGPYATEEDAASGSQGTREEPDQPISAPSGAVASAAAPVTRFPGHRSRWPVSLNPWFLDLSTRSQRNLDVL